MSQQHPPSPQFLLAMSAFRFDQGYERERSATVAPRAHSILVTTAQVPVRIEAIMVAKDCARSCALVDLKIGNSSWHASGAPVPLASFAVERAELAELCDVRSLPSDGAEDVVKPLLDLGPAQVSQQICTTIENVSAEPVEFAGAYVVRAADIYEGSSLHGHRRVVTSPPSTCEICETLLEELAQGVDWCATCGSTYVERKLRPTAFALVAPEERLARMRKLVTDGRGF